jgi:hypothetical protein
LFLELADVSPNDGEDYRFWLFPAGLIFSIHRLLQLFLGLVVEFVVFARGLARLLPELISPPDNIHFFGCGHAYSFRLWGIGNRGETPARQELLQLALHASNGVGRGNDRVKKTCAQRGRRARAGPRLCWILMLGRRTS